MIQPYWQDFKRQRKKISHFPDIIENIRFDFCIQQYQFSGKFFKKPGGRLFLKLIVMSRYNPPGHYIMFFPIGMIQIGHDHAS